MGQHYRVYTIRSRFWISINVSEPVETMIRAEVVNASSFLFFMFNEKIPSPPERKSYL